jgi:hypothetical protein
VDILLFPVKGRLRVTAIRFLVGVTCFSVSMLLSSLKDVLSVVKTTDVEVGVISSSDLLDLSMLSIVDDVL